MTSSSREGAVSGKARNRLRARRLNIDTHYEAVVFMRKDCPVCRAEGFTAHARVRVSNGRHSIIATLFQVTDHLLEHNEAGLSEPAWRRLGLNDGGEVTISHPRPLGSLSHVRGKVYGEELDTEEMRQIIGDIVAGRYSDIELSSFITACSARPLSHGEMVGLTAAMTEAGDRLVWKPHPVMDKHCVGGLPGNRTTPIIVAIAAACGLTIPKTSSRAITSPAGTADTMETMASVVLDLATMRRVVEKEGGCVIWGGAVHLSPADDTLIRVERALDLDSEGQLVASVLSKKIAAGSSHVVIDVPVGATAKVRSQDAAAKLSQSLEAVAGAFDMNVSIVLTDGRQPVGRGIGPALEAHDVLAVLQGAPNRPHDLEERALLLAGALLELGGIAGKEEGASLAREVLADGRVWSKFQRICEAQGGMREPGVAARNRPVLSSKAGHIRSIDNRRLAKVAKLAGAPEAKEAGVELHVHLGDVVAAGEPLYTVHAEAAGELVYSLDYVAGNGDIIEVGEA